MATKTARRDAGSGSLFYDAKRELWTASISLPAGADGKRRRKIVRAKTKGDAAKKLRDLRAELDRAGNLATSSPTVERWATEWLANRKRDMKPTSWVTYERTVTRYIVPVLGRKRLDKLTTEDVRRVARYITDDLGRSATTAATAHGVLVAMLKAAVVEGRTPRNVAALLPRPKRAINTRGALSAEQARKVLRWAAAPGREREFVRWSLALLLGMRQGECLGLTRDEIDLRTGHITVAWQLQSLRWDHGCGQRLDGVWPCGRKRGAWCPQKHVLIPPHHEALHLVDSLHLLRPKTDKGWRTIPIPEPLHQALKRYMAQVEPGVGNLLLHRGGEARRPIPDYVDAPAWHAALAAAGVPDVPLHSARHTTASLLRELGIPADVRMQILGHASEKVTAGYTHMDDTEARAALGQMGTLLLGE